MKRCSISANKDLTWLVSPMYWTNMPSIISIVLKNKNCGAWWKSMKKALLSWHPNISIQLWIGLSVNFGWMHTQSFLLLMNMNTIPNTCHSKDLVWIKVGGDYRLTACVYPCSFFWLHFLSWMVHLIYHYSFCISFISIESLYAGSCMNHPYTSSFPIIIPLNLSQRIDDKLFALYVGWLYLIDYLHLLLFERFHEMR